VLWITKYLINKKLRSRNTTNYRKMPLGVCISCNVKLFLIPWDHISAVFIYRLGFVISKLTVATYLQASEAVVRSICIGAAEGLACWRRHLYCTARLRQRSLTLIHSILYTILQPAQHQYSLWRQLRNLISFAGMGNGIILGSNARGNSSPDRRN
jgi:hypothetical protein